MRGTLVLDFPFGTVRVVMYMVMVMGTYMSYMSLVLGHQIFFWRDSYA